MKTYKELDFSNAPNMPKGFPSELQAMAAAEVVAAGMKSTVKKESWGWTVDIDDGEGSLGSIVQNGQVHWWCGGERCLRQMEWQIEHRPRSSRQLRTA